MRLRRQHRAAVRDRARQRDRPIEPGADFLHHRERTERAGMAARSGGDRDQPTRALLDRLAREAVVDHVVQRDPAPAGDRGEHVLARAERGDHHRHLPLGADRHVLVEPVVRLVDDLVDRIRRGGPVGVGAVVFGQFLGDPVQPFVEHAEGRAFSAGKLPTIPALHCAMTSSGPETMNSGEPMTGRRRRSNGAGRVVGIGTSSCSLKRA